MVLTPQARGVRSMASITQGLLQVCKSQLWCQSAHITAGFTLSSQPDGPVLWHAVTLQLQSQRTCTPCSPSSPSLLSVCLAANGPGGMMLLTRRPQDSSSLLHASGTLEQGS